MSFQERQLKNFLTELMDSTGPDTHDQLLEVIDEMTNALAWCSGLPRTDKEKETWRTQYNSAYLMGLSVLAGEKRSE